MRTSLVEQIAGLAELLDVQGQQKLLELAELLAIDQVLFGDPDPAAMLDDGAETGLAGTPH